MKIKNKKIMPYKILIEFLVVTSTLQFVTNAQPTNFCCNMSIFDFLDNSLYILRAHMEEL